MTGAAIYLQSVPSQQTFRFNNRDVLALTLLWRCSFTKDALGSCISLLQFFIFFKYFFFSFSIFSRIFRYLLKCTNKEVYGDNCQVMVKQNCTCVSGNVPRE